MSAQLSKIASFCDKLLKTNEVSDYSNAYNGLQIENDGRVTKIAAAVDSHELVVQKAIEAKADLLLVHHGMFWTNPIPLTKISYRRTKQCLDHNLAVYSSHLPLDLHPQLGNNAVLAKALGIRQLKPFYKSQDQHIGLCGTLNTSRDLLVKQLEKILKSPVHCIAAGSKQIRRIGIVTGGAGDGIAQAVEAGLDTFITGEGSHWTYGYALENKINLIYGGHYATETFGVKALASLLSNKFKVPWTFIECPSGL